MKKNMTRDSAIDAAKAISIVLVLIWHLQPFLVVSGSSGRIADIARFSLNVFYEQITLIAVPLFILVSLALFWEKLNALGTSYAVHRVRRLVFLYAVWTISSPAGLLCMY
jgi:fucose 4-O-acetylase-like acetyltransferase